MRIKKDASVTSESRNDSTDRQLASYEETAPLITGTHNVGETGGATSTISIIRKILSVNEKQVASGKKFSQRDPLQEKAVKALEKENAQLKEDVSQLRDLVKLQKKVTGCARIVYEIAF